MMNVTNESVLIDQKRIRPAVAVVELPYLVLGICKGGIRQGETLVGSNHVLELRSKAKLSLMDSNDLESEGVVATIQLLEAGKCPNAVDTGVLPKFNQDDFAPEI